MPPVPQPLERSFALLSSKGKKMKICHPKDEGQAQGKVQPGATAGKRTRAGRSAACQRDQTGGARDGCCWEEPLPSAGVAVAPATAHPASCAQGQLHGLRLRLSDHPQLFAAAFAQAPESAVPSATTSENTAQQPVLPPASVPPTIHVPETSANTEQTNGALKSPIPCHRG